MKTRPIKHYTVLVEFDAPRDAAFWDIREYIIRELESGGGNRHPDDPLFHSLSGVSISKPITPWRDPGIPRIRALKIVKLKSESET